MKIFQITLLFFLFLGAIFDHHAAAQNQIPPGYKLLFETDFNEASSFDQFTFTDPAAWRMAKVGDNKVLELFGKSVYEPRVRSPLNIAIIKNLQVSNFVLDVMVKQTGEEYGHRDMCFFWGMKDPSNFYYVHIASAADEHAHNIFLVNDEPRKAIALKTTNGVVWGQGWHKVRVVRNIQEASIKIFFDDMENPLMEASDNHFDYGSIGVGSFDDTGMFDSIKLWGEEVKKGTGFFSN